MERQESNVPTPISAQLTQLREIQALGQLLVAAGGFLAFLSLSRQIPLLTRQASIVQNLQERVTRLEKKAGMFDPRQATY